MRLNAAQGGRRRLVGWGMVAGGAAIGIEASTFDVAFLTDPVGPKALPFVAALILIAGGLHASLMRRGVEDREEASDRDGPETEPAGAALKIALAGFTFIAYALLLPALGFFLSTTGAVAALSRLYGAPLRKAFLAAAGLSAVLWLLFVQLLALPLPIGSLWIR